MHVGAANIAWTHDIWENALRMHKKQYSLNRILTRLRDLYPNFRISRSQLHANLKAFALEGPSYKPYSLHTKSGPHRSKFGGRNAFRCTTDGSGPHSVVYLPFKSDQLWELTPYGLTPASLSLSDEHSSLEDAAVRGLVSLRGGSESSSQSSTSDYSDSDSGDSRATILTRDSTPKTSPVLQTQSLQIIDSRQHMQQVAQEQRSPRVSPNARLSDSCSKPSSSSSTISGSHHTDENKPNAHASSCDNGGKPTPVKREHLPSSGPSASMNLEPRSCAGVPSRCSCDSMTVQEVVGGSLLWKAVLAGDVNASKFLLRHDADPKLEQQIGAAAASLSSSYPLPSSANSSASSSSSSSSSSSPPPPALLSSSYSAETKSLREMIGHALQRTPEREPEIMACLRAVREYRGGCLV